MNKAQLLDRFGAGGFIRPVPDEGEFKARWLTIPSSSDAFTAALHGGLIADRLSWVFLAAYQSAVRACFKDMPDQCWLSFAVSEDKRGNFPGTRLEDGKLHGSKSWIAGVNHVDHLLVTIGPSLDHGCLIVDCAGPEVELGARPDASFLADMSQGHATFHDYPINDESWVDAAGAIDFGLAEPFFVSTAACGYLLKEGQRLRLDDVVQSAQNLLDKMETLFQAGFASDLESFLPLYQSVKELGQTCSAGSAASNDQAATDWQQNGRLLGMYGKGLRARAEQ